MSASPDYMQQLLGGLLNNPQPTDINGLLGQFGGPTNLGLSILAANKPSRVPLGFGNVLAQGALDSQQLAMQQAQQRLALAQSAMSLGMNQQKLQALAPFLGGGITPQGQGNQQVPQQAANAIPQDQPVAQGSVQTQAQPQAVAADQATNPIDQIPINGMPPALYRRLAILQGKDPLETEKEIHARQLQIVQEQVKPQVDALDNVIKSDKPTQYVAANPQLMQAWKQAATRLGIDPRAGFNDQNVRTALNFTRNQLAAKAQLGQEAPNVPLQNGRLPDGRVVQIDPISGKQMIEAPSPLVKVVGKDGKPVYVPEAQAAGMRPYNEMTAASDEALQATAEEVANYKVAPPTGARLLSGNWPEVMRLVKSINPDYDATQFAMKNKARQSFATGRQGDTVRSLSVATDHLDQLSKAVDELKNGGVPAANKVANFFSQQTGNPSVTNFDAMKEIVGDEVVKAVVGATGASGDREAIKKSFSAANSPAQLYGVIAKYKGLMGGQLKGLRQQYERTTGLKDFDSAISETAKQELSGTGHPADIAALLDKYK